MAISTRRKLPTIDKLLSGVKLQLSIALNNKPTKSVIKTRNSEIIVDKSIVSNIHPSKRKLVEKYFFFVATEVGYFGGRRNWAV